MSQPVHSEEPAFSLLPEVLPSEEQLSAPQVLPSEEQPSLPEVVDSKLQIPELFYTARGQRTRWLDRPHNRVTLAGIIVFTACVVAGIVAGVVVSGKRR